MRFFRRLRYLLWFLKMGYKTSHRVRHFFWFLKMSFIDLFSWNGESLKGRIELVQEDWADMKTKNRFLEDPALIRVTEILMFISEQSINRAQQMRNEYQERE